MNGAHVAGGGFGAVLGAVIAEALRRYAGWDVSDVDAALIGSAAISVGVGIGHLASSQGILPAVRQALFGPKKSAAPAAPPPVAAIENPLDTVEQLPDREPDPDQHTTSETSQSQT